MKADKIFILSAFIYIAIFFVLFFNLGLSQSVTERISPDVFFGALLFAGYLVSTLIYGPSNFPYNKVTSKT